METIAPIETDHVAPSDRSILTYELLGGARFFNRPVRNALDAHDVIESGITSQALVHLIGQVGALSKGDTLNKAIGISLRTFQRKKKTVKLHNRLSVEQSSRTWRFAEILAQATEILGDQETAEQWMLNPAMALDGRRPIDLLSTAAGGEAVQDHLTRMDYGVYT